VIAVWIPVTSVPTSSATVAIATFITDVSNVIRNWPAASVPSTSVAPACAPDRFAGALALSLMGASSLRRHGVSNRGAPAARARSHQPREATRSRVSAPTGRSA
jgi:hypothetical protein